MSSRAWLVNVEHWFEDRCEYKASVRFDLVQGLAWARLQAACSIGRDESADIKLYCVEGEPVRETPLHRWYVYIGRLTIYTWDGVGWITETPLRVDDVDMLPTPEAGMRTLDFHMAR
jgi:hypothetical protein